MRPKPQYIVIVPDKTTDEPKGMPWFAIGAWLAVILYFVTMSL